jgi:plastocyanin
MASARAARLAIALAALGAPPSAAEDLVIVQKDKQFSEQRVVIRAGDRLVFRNEDTVSHNVFSRSPGAEFEVEVQLPGQETPISFAKPGAAEVRCAIHPNMKLLVTVEPQE